MSCPVIVTCVTCHMFSIAISDGNIGFICDKCKETVRLTEKISELETHIQTLIEDSKNARSLDSVLDATSIVNSSHVSVLAEVEPHVLQGVELRRKERKQGKETRMHK